MAMMRVLRFMTGKTRSFEKFVRNTVPVWIQIGHDMLSGLILDQFVCKCYQYTTLEGKDFNLNFDLYSRRLTTR